MSPPIDAREWAAQELRAGRDWAVREAQDLIGTREAEWAQWWTTGWITELAEAMVDTATQAWDAWQRKEPR